MTWIAAIEVDQRQKFITRTEKLQEMVGGSALISKSIELAEAAARDGISLAWPVSGVIRLVCDDGQKLARAAWSMRNTLIHDFGLPVSVALEQYEDGEFEAGWDRVETRIREIKDSRTDSDPGISNPLFALCSLQPSLHANEWRPTEKEQSRRILNYASAKRRKIATLAYTGRFQDWKVEPVNIPHDQRDLIGDSEDAYVAFIKADADDVGQLLLGNNLNTPEVSKAFAESLDVALRKAHTKAIADVTAEYDGKFPVIPIIAAGEDVWLLCRKDIAFKLALGLTAEFGSEAEKSGMSLTMSAAIIFTKQGFPIVPRLRLAEEVLRNAKRRRKEAIKDGQPKQGFLDYLWVQSTDRLQLRRERPLIDDVNEYRVFSRPWAATSAQCMLLAADKLRSFPRRKLKQLPDLLRRGRLARLAYEQWLASLTTEQSEIWSGACNLAKIEKLWNYQNGAFETSIIELAELVEITRPPGATHNE